MNVRKNCGAGIGAMTLGGIALSSLLGTTFLCGTAAADAGDNDVLDVSDLQRVADGSLDDLRGGFRVGNWDLSFGVTVTTAVNGQQVLQTSFNVNDPGQVTNLATTLGNNGNHNNNNNNNSWSNSSDNWNSGGHGNHNAQGSDNAVAQAAPQFQVVGNGASQGGNAGSAPAAGEGTQVATTPTIVTDASPVEPLTHIDPPAAADQSAPASADTSSTIVSLPPVVDTAPPTDFAAASASPLPTVAPSNGSGGHDAPADAGVDMSGIPASSNNASTNSTGGWSFTQVDGGWQATSSNMSTTIMQQVGQSITTSVANSADNQVIQNTTQMDMFLNNFEQMQAQAASGQIVSGLMNDIANHGITGN